MKIHPDYPNHPGLQPKRHRTNVMHRFRHGKIDKIIPGNPGEPAFEAIYRALVNGQAPATVTRLPTAAHPESLSAAYRLLKEDDNWKQLDPKSSIRYSRAIEKMLAMKSDSGLAFGDGPVADLRRNHVKALLAPWSATPPMKRIARIALQKLIGQAMDAWDLQFDPTAKLPGQVSDRQKKSGGRKTWPQELLNAFEAAYPLGSQPRLAYALGLWLGNRVSDIARLDFASKTTQQFEAEGDYYDIVGFEFRQFKGRNNADKKEVFLPITPMLRNEVEAVWGPMAGWPSAGPVLRSRRTRRGYTDQSLSQRFNEWVNVEAIPERYRKGYTAHGLRKALGVKLALADVSSRTIMAILGHSKLDMVEVYTREANAVRLAAQGMRELAALEERRANRKPKLSVIK
jgi:integrase